MPDAGEVNPFKSRLHRFSTPHLASRSNNPLWYAIQQASVHIIVLSSYSPMYRISNICYNVSSGNQYPVPNKSAPAYTTVGDGGNQEGLAGWFRDPQPEHSAFREASYGHSILELKNRTHAFLN
ncbi:bifunctional purple acid phosphatase 26-like [Hibiscus syriacus]|uniref:bifunctional purple acid phosphatase 26-like n=1 Tax=Hibiscus syriacus TaxID=106335 RepID=UPI0019230A9B|nr:bifunctional purple acid phosphatase 26-like [Hibiscus syriacus]